MSFDHYQSPQIQMFNKIKMRRNVSYSWSPAAPPPSPIPTGKGSRSAADPTFSEYVDKSILIPELTLPRQQAHHQRFNSKPEEISYQSLKVREDESVRGLLRSGREFGVLRITDHGISGDELRFVLANTERIFGLTIGCCNSYGDHEMLVWPGGSHDVDGDRRVMGEVGGVIGEHNFQIFRLKMDTVANQLRSIAEELAKVVAHYGRKQFQEPIRLGESKLSIYRYHRANIINRISSAIEETSQELGSFALSLHLLLEPGSLQPDGTGNLSFDTRSDTIIVTIGKELEEWSHGEFKSAQGKLLFKPFLQMNKPSFSIEQKWSISNLTNVVGESNKIISLSDQILIVLVIAVLYNALAYIYC